MARRGHDQKLQELRAIELFAGCSDRELRAVAAAFDEVHVAAGQRLCEQGRMAQAFYVIVDGAAEVSIAGHRLCSLGAGDAVGELAELDLLPRTATVRTTAPTVALTASSQAFRALLAEAPNVARALLNLLSRRLRSFDVAFSMVAHEERQLEEAGRR